MWTRSGAPVRPQSVAEHFQTETENVALRSTSDIIRRRCGACDFDAVIQMPRRTYLLKFAMTPLE